MANKFKIDPLEATLQNMFLQRKINEKMDIYKMLFLLPLFGEISVFIVLSY